MIACAAACALAAVPMFLLRGFTVDDAWIPARYAAHLAQGAGYRFNLGGPSTDGVTPLPWAFLIAPLAKGGIVEAWEAARRVGSIAWLLGAAMVGKAVFESGERRARFVALLPLALSAPLAAWAGAGLETGLAAALTAVAASLAAGPRSSLGASLSAGLAASLRPEMLPFAAVVGAWRASEVASRPRRALAVALSLSPWLLCVLIRLIAFGRPVPLSALAKPSDEAHGLAYVAAGLLLAGAPALASAPAVLLRGNNLSRARWLIAASAAHFAAVVVAGGDWMPLSRLLVPALPPLCVAAADLAERASGWATALRAALAAAGMLFAWQRTYDSARTVVKTRAALLSPARAALAGARSVAALDAGWVGAATEAKVVDLAGLTEPAIAVLPGGHTSKRVTGALLDSRGVDALVLLRRSGCGAGCARPDGGPYERAVEERLADDPWVKERFELAAVVRSGPLTYAVLRRAEPPGRAE